jgi:putative flippase GtrA
MKKAIHQKLESASKAINQELIARLLPTTLLIALACFFAYKFIAPPHLAISSLPLVLAPLTTMLLLAFIRYIYNKKVFR